MNQAGNMPARNPRGRKRNVKSRARRRYTKPRAKSKARPRTVVRTSAGSSPNVHMFTRSYDNAFSIGTADHTNGVFLNSDSKYMIIKLHTKFNRLPDYTEFKALFSEYKITSITHRMVPYYSNNISANLWGTTSGTAYQGAVPNYEIFSLPVSSSARESDLTSMTATQLDSFLNQSQRKGRRLMPSKTQKFTTMHPKVVGYKGPLDKSGGTAMLAMENPVYLNTDPAALVTGGVDQTDVSHYGIVLIIRRVDGGTLSSPTTAGAATMGARMETQVYFKTRKVQ